jgi:hypothetical protein
MRLLLAALLAISVRAQQSETAAIPVESPVPAAETQVTGFMELGYRWRTGVAGSMDAYRSVVDLGSGPKLLRTEFSFEDPKHRLFDRIDARAYNWGDDPYSTLNITARKERLYDFSADYRNMAYFNFLPSFADPLLSRGILLNERSFDIRRRTSSFRLELLPGNWIVPYLAYERSSSFGRAITTFVGDANEYPVPSRNSDHMNNYRAGARLEFSRLHFTLEQGGTTFKDDQSVFDGPDARNRGNRDTLFLGQNLFLANLLQSYGVRATSIYTRAVASAVLTPWLNISGDILYSRPETYTNYRQFDTGNQVVSSEALLFTTEQRLLSSSARLPHKTATFSVELLPQQRIRLLLSWMTDRLENSGLSNGQQILNRDLLQRTSNIALNSYLQNEYNHGAADVIFDVSRKLTLRAGYRYVWGEAQSFVLPEAGLQQAPGSKLQRNIFSGGASFRPTSKLSVYATAEGAASGRTYFRTSLHDYQRASVRVRYQVTGSLNVAADYRILNNQNPIAGIAYDFRSQQSSFTLAWAPGGGKRVSVQGDYTRSTLRSDITYLVPQTLQRDRSFYRDDGHSVGAIIDLNLPGHQGLAPKVSFGGSMFRSSGSRSTAYYQPLAKVFLPVTKNIAWISEWKYYGLGEAFYTYEGFRTHLIETGIRFSR